MALCSEFLMACPCGTMLCDHSLFPSKALATREAEEVLQLPPTWHLAQEKSPFPRFSPYIVGLPGTSAR